MYIAAAEKTVQFPFPRGLTHLCKDASTQAHMLVRRQQVQRIEAKRKVLIATVACHAIAEIACTLAAIHDQICHIICLLQPRPFPLRLFSKIIFVDPCIRIDSTIRRVPCAAPGLGKQLRIRDCSASDKKILLHHLGSSISARIASSAARICFFIEPSSTWS